MQTIGRAGVCFRHKLGSELLESKVSEHRVQLFPEVFLLFLHPMQLEGISFSWLRPGDYDHGFRVRQTWPFHSWLFKLGVFVNLSEFRFPHA